MRIVMLTGWLMVPLIGTAWYYGPGQELLKLDHIAAKLGEADGAAATGQWQQAVELYADALQLVPPDRVAEIRRIRLERDKAQILANKLPAAHIDLKDLVQEIAADPKHTDEQLAEARSVLANAQYYVTWLMRLEGEAREDWEPEIEAARQNFSLLAEQAVAKGDQAGAKKFEEDLESAIRLERMDLADLQGIPLPSQCQKTSTKKSRRPPPKGKKEGKPKNDKDGRNNNNGPPPDDGGH